MSRRQAVFPLLLSFIVLALACRPPDPTVPQHPVTERAAAIALNDRRAAYILAKFPTGEFGLVAVISGGQKTSIVPQEAESGKAVVYVDDSVYRLSYSGEDTSESEIIRYLKKAVRKHIGPGEATESGELDNKENK